MHDVTSSMATRHALEVPSNVMSEWPWSLRRQRTVYSIEVTQPQRSRDADVHAGSSVVTTAASYCSRVLGEVAGQRSSAARCFDVVFFLGFVATRD